MCRVNVLSRISLLAGVLGLWLAGGLMCPIVADEPGGGDDGGPLPVVAVGMHQCLLTVEITGGIPQQSVTNAEVIDGFRERLGQALVNSGSVELLEQQSQLLMDGEIRKRIDRGEDPQTVIIEVGRQYKVNEYVMVTTLEFHCEYDPGIFGFGRCSKGSGRAVASFVNVATGTTEKKPEAQVAYLKLKDAQPPAWFSEAERQLADELVAQRYPIRPIKVIKVHNEPPDLYVVINRGNDGGVIQGRKFVLRDPSEVIEGETVLGQRIGEITVTDRVGPRIAICVISKVLKTTVDRNGKVRGMSVPELLAYIEGLLTRGTPPEATEQ
jgi:hypothetical protein